jgi:hypothetical protein
VLGEDLVEDVCQLAVRLDEPLGMRNGNSARKQFQVANRDLSREEVPHPP